MYQQFVDLTLAVQAFFSFCYLITSFIVGSNPYAGFIAVFTALIYIGYIAVAWYGIRRKPTRLMYGGILGGCLVLVCMSLMDAIFWGQYAQCHTWDGVYRRLDSRQLTGVYCKQRPAMRALCAFSVFMFLSYLVLTGIMMKFKNEILATVPDEGYSNPAGEPFRSSSFNSMQPSSDSKLGRLVKRPTPILFEAMS
eukprot:gene4900-9767_t